MQPQRAMGRGGLAVAVALLALLVGLCTLPRHTAGEEAGLGLWDEAGSWRLVVTSGAGRPTCNLSGQT